MLVDSNSFRTRLLWLAGQELADRRRALTNVWSQGQSRKHWLTLSLSHFDPQQPSAQRAQTPWAPFDRVIPVSSAWFNAVWVQDRVRETTRRGPRAEAAIPVLPAVGGR
jgi:hypothetical protein